MTSLPERGLIMDMVAEAMTAGARQDRACQAITLSERTLQRWQSGPTAAGDGRPERRQVPRNQLSTQERAQVLSIANSAAFGHLPPQQHDSGGAVQQCHHCVGCGAAGAGYSG